MNIVAIPSFFLELFLHWSPVAYWVPTDLGNSSLNVVSFCLFILFMGFSRQEYWSGLPFPGLTEAEDVKKRWQEYTENLYKKDLHDPDNHEGVITPTHLEPDILECEVRWALGSITTNKAGGGDGILVELFQILKDNAVKVLHSICQQIWKSQQWPQDWKRSVFIPVPKKGNAKECQTTAKLHSSHMLAK